MRSAGRRTPAGGRSIPRGPGSDADRGRHSRLHRRPSGRVQPRRAFLGGIVEGLHRRRCLSAAASALLRGAPSGEETGRRKVIFRAFYQERLRRFLNEDRAAGQSCPVRPGRCPRRPRRRPRGRCCSPCFHTCSMEAEAYGTKSSIQPTPRGVRAVLGTGPDRPALISGPARLGDGTDHPGDPVLRCCPEPWHPPHQLTGQLEPPPGLVELSRPALGLVSVRRCALPACELVLDTGRHVKPLGRDMPVWMGFSHARR